MARFNAAAAYSLDDASLSFASPSKQAMKRGKRGENVPAESSDELRRSDRSIARLTQQLQDARLFARECRIRETQQKRARALLVKSGAAETAETVKARLQKRRNDHLVDPTKIYIRAVVVQLIAIEREQTQLIRKLAQVSRDHRTAGPTERRSLGSGSAAWRNLEADVLTRVQFPSVTQMETTVKVGGCFESAMIIQ